MSTLFESYYDFLGHELTYGSTVGFTRGQYTIYGTVIDIVLDEKAGYKFVIIPNIGWRGPSEPKLQKSYKVSHNKIFEIICHKSKRSKVIKK